VSDHLGSEVEDDKIDKTLRIALVGPCSAGKTTLGDALKSLGFTNIRKPAQEHSYVVNMWQRLSKPDVLIYLDVDYSNARMRRPHIDGGPERLADQHQRLAHAHQNCDYYIDTSGLTPIEIQSKILEFLQDIKVQKKG